MIRFQEQDIIQICLEKLSEKLGSSVHLSGTKSLGGGCINHAVKISTSAGDFFLKWNASAASDVFQKEAAGLAEMRSIDNSLLVIPEVIWSKDTDDLPGLLLMEYLAPALSSIGYSEQLGRGIARLHRKKAAQFGFHHDNYCGTTVQDNSWNGNWPDFFAKQRIWTLVLQISSSRGMATEELKVYEKLIRKIPDILAHQTFPSLIHGDLWSGNYLYSAHGPALIDPACYYADREMELGMMNLFGGFPSRVWDAYQEEFPLPLEWRERLDLYQLYHVLNHYLMFGVSYKYQALQIAGRYL
jgi:protein-ribulosamine 3-kinase